MTAGSNMPGFISQQFPRCFHASTLGHLKDTDASTASPLSVLDILALDSPQSVSPKYISSGVPAYPLPPLARRSLSRRSSQLSKAGSLSSECSTPSKSGYSQLETLEPMPYACPASPPARPRTRARAGLRTFSRSSSLNDKKVLVATQLKRSPSLTCPDLFTFEDHFDFQAVIGRSQFSEVYQVRHKRNDELFAVKRSTRKFRSKAHRERCMHEIEAVAALPAHPNIVGQYRAWQQGGHFYIQMDLCTGGSLGHLLAQVKSMSSTLPEETVWQVLYQTCQGLNFLHSHGVLHLDIKPDNLYRDATGTFKIGDFGLAVLRKQWDWEEGDGDYVAPEMLSDTSEPSGAADIYSLGATLYECATGEKLPRSGPARECGQVSLPGRSAALQWVIQWMINPDPAARPSAQDVLMQVSSLQVPLSGSPLAPTNTDSECTTPTMRMASRPAAWDVQDPGADSTPRQPVLAALPFSAQPMSSPLDSASPAFRLRPQQNTMLSPVHTPSPLHIRTIRALEVSPPAPGLMQHGASPMEQAPSLPVSGLDPAPVLSAHPQHEPSWPSVRDDVRQPDMLDGGSPQPAARASPFSARLAQEAPSPNIPSQPHAEQSWRPQFVPRMASPFSRMQRPVDGQPSLSSPTMGSATSSRSPDHARLRSAVKRPLPALVIPGENDADIAQPSLPMACQEPHSRELEGGCTAGAAHDQDDAIVEDVQSHDAPHLSRKHDRTWTVSVSSPAPLSSDGSGSNQGWEAQDPVRPATASPAFTTRQPGSGLRLRRRTNAPDRMLPWDMGSDAITGRDPSPQSPQLQHAPGRMDDSCISMAESDVSAVRPFPALASCQSLSLEADEACKASLDSPGVPGWQGTTPHESHLQQQIHAAAAGGRDVTYAADCDAGADAAMTRATMCDSPLVPKGHRRSGSHPPYPASSSRRRNHWSRQPVVASLSSLTVRCSDAEPGPSPVAFSGLVQRPSLMECSASQPVAPCEPTAHAITEACMQPEGGCHQQDSHAMATADESGPCEAARLQAPPNAGVCSPVARPGYSQTRPAFGLPYLPHRQASLQSWASMQSAEGDAMAIEDMTGTIRQLSMTRELSMLTSFDLDA